MNFEINLYKKQIRRDIKFFISKLKLNEVIFFSFNYINYINYVENEINNLILILKNIDLIEFVYISPVFSKVINNEIIEKNRDGLIQFNGIFGVRSLSKDNKSLNLNIIDYLRTYYEDIKINLLMVEIDILKYWNYIIKDNLFENHYFIFFSKVYTDCYGLFIDKLNYFRVNNLKCLNIKYVEGKYFNIIGLPSLKQNDFNLLYYYISLYFNLKNYKINNNKIYSKNKQFKYSWDFVAYIDFFIKKNMIFIYKELCNIFKFHLEISDSIELLINNTISSLNIISNDFPLFLKFEINENVYEFLDGLYFVNYDYFFCYKENKNLINININCVKYFLKNYKTLKKLKPKYWLNLLKSNFKNNKDLIEFCTSFGYYFNSNIKISEYIEKKTLVISGSTNTGKTLLIVNVLLSFYNINEIDLLSNMDDNFIFENKKKIYIIFHDAFNFIKGSFLLNLLYKRSKKKVLFIVNENENLKLISAYYKKRLLIYNFSSTINIPNFKFIKEKLNDEILSILIFCNHLYFQKYSTSSLRTEYRKLCLSMLLTVEKNNELLF